MKKTTVLRLLTILVSMTILVPHSVYADNGEDQSPEGWLHEEEREYVSQMRTAFAGCREVMSKMRGLLTKPDVYSFQWGYDINIQAGLLTAAYQPFCSLVPPGSMNVLTPEQTRLCGVAQVCAAQGTSTGNEWMTIASQFNMFRPMPTIRLLDNMNGTINRLESAMSATEGKLNSRIAEIAKEREAAAELVADLLGECGCFIVTAAYGSPMAKEVALLQLFRDEFLMDNAVGKALIDFYYAISPPIAGFISEHEVIRTIVREGFVDPVASVVDRTRTLWSR